MSNFKTEHIVPLLLIIGMFLSAGLFEPFPERPQTGFWAMEGTLVTHYFDEKSDSLSGPELFELQDKNGLPIWFGRHIFKDVCLAGECKLIRLWLFWDGVGNYLGLQIPEHEPLTKSDHTPFEPKDYEKLDNILRDTASILKELKQEELVIVPDTINPFDVDGYTAATQPTLAEAVVKNAVYTCHTLWHTVYGPVKTQIFKILQNHLSKEFLEKMFESDKPEYISWAIECVKSHPEYHANFYTEIMDNISSGNSVLANCALSYFGNEMLADTTIQLQLVCQVMADPGTDRNIKYEILWRFIEHGKIHQEVVLRLLEMFVNQEIDIGTYHLILRLIAPRHMHENEQIAIVLNQLSQNQNSYVRNLTIRTLDDLKNHGK